ncbi:DUF998 domain-containing protein [Nakamurella lactea]|uniref:DUF998 domain-containing protein n=1 Tax=Nakamurella lactea TaxID=459515 RepID=UPI00042A7980|nr:DUF998 domain-containing protein [Nakamurella lactea]
MNTPTLVSAAITPVALFGGAEVAVSRQPAGYSSVHNSISAMAATGANDRWIMTAALAVVGTGYLLTAVGLAEARTVSRVLLGLGGLATIVVAALPQPNPGHVPMAGLAFVALAIWPAVSGVPSWVGGLLATAVLTILLAWFGVQLAGGWLGLTERLLAGAQALWPLAVAIVLIRRDRRGRTGRTLHPGEPRAVS